MSIQPTTGFAILAIAFGVLFGAMTPPLQVPDEQRHLTRAYSLSEGQVFPDPDEPAVGTNIPRSIDEMRHRLAPGMAYDPRLRQDLDVLRAEFARELAPDDRVFAPIGSLYSPLPYVAPAVGIAALRAFDAAPVWFVYGGRLVNLALYVALVFAAIKVTPAGRFVFVALGLLPMALFEAASLAADPMTTGLAYLWIALILRARDADERLGKREALTLLGVAAALGLAKPGYWPLVALVFAIPTARFDGTRRHLGAGLVAATIGLVPSLLWGAALASYGTPHAAPGVDPAGQIRFILSQPMEVLATLARSFAQVGWVWWMSFVGVLGHIDILLPRAAYFLALPLLASVALDGGAGRPFTPRFRFGVLALGMTMLFSILGIGYLSWNQVGAPMILGVQGRYMLPFGPLFLIPALLTHRPAWVARVEPLWWAACALGATAALVAIWSRYYGPVGGAA